MSSNNMQILVIERGTKQRFLVTGENETTYFLANVIDDMHGASHISNLFSQKYDDLYNSVSYNSNDINELVDNISDKIKYG